MTRKQNFYAGPSIVPEEVLKTISEQMVTFGDSGLSLVETSHRSPEYDAVHQNALNLFREIFKVPENFKILFIGGGATLQFGMIPMNILPEGSVCDIVLTGTWSKKAYSDISKSGKVNVVYDGKESNYSTLPEPKTIKCSPDSAFLYMTSNETIGGIQWKDWPDTGDVPIVCDMSSDILSRDVPWEKFGLVFAGAQKNLGPAGVTIVIIRDDLLERSPETLPAYLNYNTHANADSLYNTPPVFSIWAMELVLERMKKLGGIDYFSKENTRKADLLYSTIEGCDGFYSSPVDKTVRSEMNVVFKTPSEELDAQFTAEAKAAGLMGLKGHRSVGGCRASIYNGMTYEGVKTLTDFMKDFAEKNR